MPMARTPPRFLAEGDRIEVEVEGVGTLVNHVGRELATKAG